MKIAAHLILACLAVGGYSDIINLHPHPMKAVLVNVKNDIEALHSSVRSFNGDDKPVVSAAEKVISTIKAGKTTIDASAPVTGPASFDLQEPMMDLVASGMSLSGYLKTRRSDVVKAGLCDEVHRLVTDINTASQAFIESVINKFPTMVQSIARIMSRELIDELDETQEYFSADNCKNGSGGGGITSSSTSAAPSRPASSSVPTSTSISSSSSSTTSVSTATVSSTSSSSVYTSTYSSAISSVTSTTTSIHTRTTRTLGRTTSHASSSTTAPETPTGSTGVPQVTGGAAIFAPAGALAVAVAAVLL